MPDEFLRSLKLPLAALTHVLISLILVGCTRYPPESTFDEVGASAARLRLATTTSVRDSGLLDSLIPPFEDREHCRVDVVAVGTGAALKLGEAGDADVLIVHARPAENAFMTAQHGVRHDEFMVNSFLLLGPRSDRDDDPTLNPIAALREIARSDKLFVSRGDGSGTHQREQRLWQEAGTHPQPKCYLESGQGMGATLIMADEKRAYVLSDLGTFLRFRDQIDLVEASTPSALMRNPYSAIVVNPARTRLDNSELANRWVDFLISEPAQRLIANYQLSDKQLFFPTRLSNRDEE